ncbi:MAG TPA: class I SAM-dependent methyltransferase [Paraburkholderia sp.]|uniref:class I SAM-dependent methyltransferase n=1 Tax=Paraburkholderia sp. TaxID=1926495 RepID=UPI002B498491|nr:class I SAM-dependent methyltransferase [Paraburkholderia sp.]HKR41463.1 class I SAM-dependent methyltransferase [Paraburkholderia sp.]
MNAISDFTGRLHSEKQIDGFTKLDGTVRFYSFVKAIMLRGNARAVLDYGAGRGAFWYETHSIFKRQLQDLRLAGAVVTACDIDEAVLEHPCSDRQIVLRPDERLPFGDQEFDVIVSDFTFEHLSNPDQTCAELLRVLRPGGFICARTPNKFGYVKLLTQLVPNGRHAQVLKRVQPGRRGGDVFPTLYKLNSVRDVKKHFPGCGVYHYVDSAEPAYFFGREWIYRSFLLLHKVLPERWGTSICFFIQRQTS